MTQKTANPAPAPPLPAPSPADAADARTGRMMDNVLALGAAAGLTTAGLRALAGLQSQLATSWGVRGWPPSRKAVVELPYAERARQKRARRVPGRLIDPAANMRALGARPHASPDGRESAIARNLAQTAANRAVEKYDQGYARTNYEPLGRRSTGSPATAAVPMGRPPAPPAPAPAAGPRPSPAPPTGAAGLSGLLGGGAASVPGLAGMLGAARGPSAGPRAPVLPGASPARVDFPSVAPAPGLPPSPPPARGDFLSVAPPARPQAPALPGVGPLSTLTRPPGGGGIAPVGGDFKFAAAEQAPPPSALGRGLASALGLLREGAARSPGLDWINPPDNVDLMNQPWAYAAIPASLGLGAVAGWKGMGAVDRAYRSLDGAAEVGEAKKRYEEALRRRVLAKSAGEGPTLDDLAEARTSRPATEAEKRASLSSPLVGLLAALGAGGFALGATTAASRYGDTEAKMLRRAVRERQREVDRAGPRPIVLDPKPLEAPAAGAA